VYGLAGLRIGYAIGDTPVLEAMNRLRTPFNLTGVSQAAALAALDDAGHVNRSIQENAAERAKLTKGLSALGLRPVRSHTNFIFIDIGQEAQELCDELLHEGVIVRPSAGWASPMPCASPLASPKKRSAAGSDEPLARQTRRQK